VSLTIADIMHPKGRVFLRSEFAPVSGLWPCIAFSKRTAREALRRNYQKGRDIIVSTGTQNPEMTTNSLYRGRIISATKIEPAQEKATREIVSREVWESSFQKWGKEKWPHALPALRIWRVTGPPYPDAHDVIPKAYSQLGDPNIRGSAVEVIGDERLKVMDVKVDEIIFELSQDVADFQRRLAESGLG
jgi:hypothetical protein